MVAKVFIILALIVYLVLTFATSYMLSAREMRRRFIDGQCIVGKIAANIFYAPAWFLKGLKFVITRVVK